MSYDTFTPFFLRYTYTRTVLFTLYDVKVFEIYDFVCGCMGLVHDWDVQTVRHSEDAKSLKV